MNNEITNAVGVLKSGGIILYPTDTIWGIGCDACCDTAVRKVFWFDSSPNGLAVKKLRNYFQINWDY